MKIKKGDKVKVIYGKDKGRQGMVEKVYLKSDKVLIANINIYKRHVKKSEQMPKGGIVDVPRPLAVSKMMIICSKCGKTTRVKYQVEKNKKYRVCKKCESKI